MAKTKDYSKRSSGEKKRAKARTGISNKKYFSSKKRKSW